MNSGACGARIHAFWAFLGFFFVENDTNSYPSTGLNTDRRASGVEKMDSGRHFTLGMIYPNRLF